MPVVIFSGIPRFSKKLLSSDNLLDGILALRIQDRQDPCGFVTVGLYQMRNGRVVVDRIAEPEDVYFLPQFGSVLPAQDVAKEGAIGASRLLPGAPESQCRQNACDDPACLRTADASIVPFLPHCSPS